MAIQLGLFIRHVDHRKSRVELHSVFLPYMVPLCVNAKLIQHCNWTEHPDHLLKEENILLLQKWYRWPLGRKLREWMRKMPQNYQMSHSHKDEEGFALPQTIPCPHFRTTQAQILTFQQLGSEGVVTVPKSYCNWLGVGASTPLRRLFLLSSLQLFTNCLQRPQLLLLINQRFLIFSALCILGFSSAWLGAVFSVSPMSWEERICLSSELAILQNLVPAAPLQYH